MKNFKALDHTLHMASQTVPKMRYDSSMDFEKWQAEAREKLLDILGLPFEKCEDLFEISGKTQEDGYKVITFTFQSEKDYFIEGDFLIPDGVTGPLPLAITLMGHATGKHISLGKPKFEHDAATIAGGRDFAVRAIKEGCCAAVIESRYMGTTAQADDGAPLCSRKNAALPALLLGRTAIGERVWDVMRLIDVLFDNFSEYIDKENVICLGNSGGGTMTYYAACLDERIRIAVPSCAVCSFDESIMPIHHCCCNYVPGIRKYFDMGDMGGLIAPRKLCVVCGVLDRDFPLHGVEKSFDTIKSTYEAIGKGDSCYLVRGQKGHQFYPDEAWPVIHSFIK